MSEQPNTNLSDIVADAVWSAFDTFGIDDNDRLVDLLCQKFQDVLASDPRFPRLTNLEFDLLVADPRPRCSAHCRSSGADRAQTYRPRHRRGRAERTTAGTGTDKLRLFAVPDRRAFCLLELHHAGQERASWATHKSRAWSRSVRELPASRSRHCSPSSNCRK